MHKFFTSFFSVCVFSLQIGILLPFNSSFAVCPPPLPPLTLTDIPPPAQPAPNSCPLVGVDTVADYLPITLRNDSTLPDSDIYISVLVNSKSQYLSFTLSGGHYLGAVTSFTPVTYLSDPLYSTPLSSFESTGVDQYTFYIPNTGRSGDPSSSPLISSQIIISIDEPLTYFIDSTGSLGVPAINNAVDDNYFILNDKIEFDLGSNDFNRLNLNLTGVDFFGLPLFVQANYLFFFGSSYTPNCAVTGWPSAVSFADVFSGYRTALDSLTEPFKGYWEGLIATYTNPSGSVSDLRIFSPNSAMTLPAQTQTNPSLVTFPIAYYLSSAFGNPPCTWFNAVWSGQTESGQTAFYQQKTTPPHALILDATTTHGPATATGTLQTDGSFSFVIHGNKSNPDKGATVIIPTPQNSKAFFTGAVSDYVPSITGSATTGAKAQIFKVFATSVIAGIFPFDSLGPPPTTITQDYLESRSADYFENNSELENLLAGCTCESNIPWFDFYSRTLLTLGTPNHFYTSAYSDELGADGTIVIVSLNDENAAATILVVLNSLSGVTLPDPYTDATNFSITVAFNPQTMAEYGTSATGPWLPISNPIASNGDPFFLRVTYTEPPYDTSPFIVQVAPRAEITHPVLPFPAVITTTGVNSTVSLGGP